MHDALSGRRLFLTIFLSYTICCLRIFHDYFSLTVIIVVAVVAVAVVVTVVVMVVPVVAIVQ